MEKHEYDTIQKALDNHLDRVMEHACFNRQERNAYEKAVMACKSILSKNCIKEWENETPDANKCGLECIRTNVERICVKPEKGQCPRCKQLVGESLERIQQLEVELAAAERERDAAVAGLKKAAALGKVCIGCIHVDCDIGEMCQQNDFDCWNCRPGCVCKGCVNNSLWQWRGVCPENTEVHEDE